MRDSFLRGILFLWSIAFLVVHCEVLVNAGGPMVRWTGRVMKLSDESVRFDWPCVKAEIHLRGATEISVDMDGGNAEYTVYIDGVAMQDSIRTSLGRKRYVLASQLTSESHTIQIVRRNEASYFVLREIMDLYSAHVYSFVLPNGSVPIPPEPSSSIRLEVFGDSDSNGFGILGSDNYMCMLDLIQWEDCDVGYASQLARAVDAELHLEAWSGKGVVKNAVGWSSESSNPMPIYWNRTLATDPSLFWDFSSWIPHVVIVLLGSNDYFLEPYPSNEAFETAYVSLLESIHEAYKDSIPHPILLNLCGGRSSGPFACQRVQPSVLTFSRLYPNVSVHYYAIPDDLLVYPADYGCLDHRNLHGQTLLFEWLLPIVLPLLQNISISNN